MNGQPSDDKPNARNALRKIDDSYVFDVSSGLYKPTSYAERKDPKTKYLYKFFTIVLLAGTVYFTGRQWKETKKAADAADSAAKTAQATLRPWLDLDASIDGPLTFDKQGAHLPVSVSIQN